MNRDRENACGWTDVDAVDYLLGHFSTRKEESYRRHCRQCETCQHRLSSWRHSLHGYERTVPPSGLKLRLRHSVRRWRIVRLFRIQPAVWAPMLALVILLFVSGHLLKHDIAEEAVQLPAYEQWLQEMAAHPASVHYPIESAGGWNVQGQVWVRNGDELLMQLQGLPQYDSIDYQAWLNKRGATVNGGIIQLHGEQGLLYVRGTPVGEADNVTVSLEPKGGSRQPTGPHAVWVLFR